MIYETVVVVHPDSGENGVTGIKTLVKDVIKQFKGEVILDSDWGMRVFGQPRSSGLTRGHYIYVMFRSTSDVNKELERRFKIQEEVVNFLLIRLGEDRYLEKYKKAYKNPFQVSSEDTANGKTEADLRKDRKIFARRRSCWFTANKVTPDWKDISSYQWVVNEFGKISPARVSGISRKMQRLATKCVKRGRAMGLVSHISNRVAH